MKTFYKIITHPLFTRIITTARPSCQVSSFVLKSFIFVGYRNDRFFPHTNPYISKVTQQCRCTLMFILQAWATCVITCSDDITSALQIESLFTHCGQNVVAFKPSKMWSALKRQRHGPGPFRYARLHDCQSGAKPGQRVGVIFYSACCNKSFVKLCYITARA